MTRDSSGKPRTSLGDLTNQLGKRGFSLISRSPASKSAAGNPNYVNSENDSPSSKRIDLGRCKDTAGSGAKADKLLKGGKTYRLLSLGNANAAANPGLPIGDQSSSATISPMAVASGGIKTQSSSSETSKHRSEMPEDPIVETLGSQVASSEGKESGLCAMPSAVDLGAGSGTGLSNSQTPKPFELQKCVLLKDNPPDAGSLQACSCSFCVKAAYIWSNLHFMDVKGRISALTKSKKEASNLVKMYSVDNNMGSRGGEGSSSSSSQPDMDLMKRCKSLFVYMEDSLVREHNQLETKFSSLKRIREDLKMNLETATEVPPDAQHTASTDPSGTRLP